VSKFTEEELSKWTKPPSDTEESKVENAIRMVKEAINNDDKLKAKSIEVFAQGSYANNTNVRLNSDIDINVRYTGAFYSCFLAKVLMHIMEIGIHLFYKIVQILKISFLRLGISG